MSARRGWARPLVPLYAAGLRVKEALRREPKKLQWPVVSVGSLSAGGAGKTPVVIALAGLLKDAGWRVDVLSRGYGRDGGEVEAVNVGAGGAERFGDEPVLIAERTGVPVFVGASRFAAGVAAEPKTGAPCASEKQVPRFARNDNQKSNNNHLHLLDDGFQHRQLARAVDVVVITAEDLDDVLIPAGNLREPLGALARADVVIVREDEVESVAKRVWPLLRERAQIWVVRRRLRFPAPLFVFGAGLRPVAFCGLARPEGFAAMLAEAGCGVVETVAFQDHRRYTAADMGRVV
jgi:tetraacyldisaccharide 4'-kinase